MKQDLKMKSKKELDVLYTRCATLKKNLRNVFVLQGHKKIDKQNSQIGDKKKDHRS